MGGGGPASSLPGPSTEFDPERSAGIQDHSKHWLWLDVIAGQKQRNSANRSETLACGISHSPQSGIGRNQPCPSRSPWEENFLECFSRCLLSCISSGYTGRLDRNRNFGKSLQWHRHCCLPLPLVGHRRKLVEDRSKPRDLISPITLKAAVTSKWILSLLSRVPSTFSGH